MKKHRESKYLDSFDGEFLFAGLVLRLMRRSYGRLLSRANISRHSKPCSCSVVGIDPCNARHFAHGMTILNSHKARCCGRRASMHGAIPDCQLYIYGDAKSELVGQSSGDSHHICLLQLH